MKLGREEGREEGRKEGKEERRKESRDKAVNRAGFRDETDVRNITQGIFRSMINMWKYLEIILTKYTQYLKTKNYKTLM